MARGGPGKHRGHERQRQGQGRKRRPYPEGLSASAFPVQGGLRMETSLFETFEGREVDATGEARRRGHVPGKSRDQRPAGLLNQS